MAKVLRVLLDAEENLSKAFKGGALQTQELAGQLHGLAEKALGAVIDFSQEAVEKTKVLGLQQRDLARAMGTSAEEAGALQQTADDLGISYESLLSGVKRLNKNGIEPSTANILALADQYKALPDSVSKAQFAAERFGKQAGPEMQKLLEQSTGELRGMIAAQKDSALVMSTDQVEAIEQNRIAQDGLNDAVDEARVLIGNELIPLETELAQVTAENLVPAIRGASKVFHEGTEAGGNLVKIAQALLLQARLSTGAIDAETAALEAQRLVNNGLTDEQVRTHAAEQALGDTRREAIEQIYALNAATEDEANATEIAARAHDRLQAALKAGLSGQILSTQEDYAATIRETTPEVERLTTQIGKWQAAQGQSFIVTTEATTSLAEYELATIKAAAAQKKLEEFTGDDREELLTLQVAAEGAQEKVAQLGEGFGITREFTADYTKQIAEANGTLAELTAKQAEAEEQLRKTTSEFIYQQVAAQLDDAAALELGHKLGLVDDASYNLALRVASLTQKWDLDKDGLIEVGKEADGLTADLGNLQSATVEQTKAAANSAGPLAGMADDFGTLEQRAADAAFDVRDVAVATGALDGAHADVTITTHHVDDYSLAGSTTETRRQHGGPEPVGPEWVGEGGPELRWGRGGFIQSNSDSRRMIGLLEQIAAAGLGAAPVAAPVQIFLDGQLLAEVVGARLGARADARLRMGIS